MLKPWASAKIQPPDLIALFHVIVNPAKNPDSAVPNPACMIVTWNKLPSSGPSPSFQVQEADIV
jgi:hypothetical protein